MMNFIMIQDWPQDIGGKPSFSYIENMPAFVPIMFEMSVFFAAHLMVITFYMRSKLWPFKEAENPDPRTTDDMFVMEVAVDGNEIHVTHGLVSGKKTTKVTKSKPMNVGRSNATTAEEQALKEAIASFRARRLIP